MWSKPNIELNNIELLFRFISTSNCGCETPKIEWIFSARRGITMTGGEWVTGSSNLNWNIALIGMIMRYSHPIIRKLFKKISCNCSYPSKLTVAGWAWLNTTNPFLLHLPFLVISELLWTIVSTMTGVKSTIINVKVGMELNRKPSWPGLFCHIFYSSLSHLAMSCCCNIEVNDQSRADRNN